jgi:hypothetical protein
MFHYLPTLRKNIDRLITDQGENAACCGIVYTKEDVIDFFDYKDDSMPKDPEFITEVLVELGDSDEIYDYINEKLEIIIQQKLRKFQ